MPGTSPASRLRGLAQAHPGHPRPHYLWAVEHLFRDNELIRRELRVGGERVDLWRIVAPVKSARRSA
jgi:poly(3-hydroxyalkanoate) synthetase